MLDASEREICIINTQVMFILKGGGLVVSVRGLCFVLVILLMCMPGDLFFLKLNLFQSKKVSLSLSLALNQNSVRDYGFFQLLISKTNKYQPPYTGFGSAEKSKRHMRLLSSAITQVCHSAL